MLFVVKKWLLLFSWEGGFGWCTFVTIVDLVKISQCYTHPSNNAVLMHDWSCMENWMGAENQM